MSNTEIVTVALTAATLFRGNYKTEDFLKEAEGFKLSSQRKSNLKRQRPGWTEYVMEMMRKK